MQMKGLLRIALLALLVLLVQGTWVLAGTTGRIEGVVSDTNGNGIQGAKVTAAAPGQTAGATTGASGFFVILNLSPNTFEVTASKDGYDPATVYGKTVLADQSTAVDISLRATVKTIGHVTTTATASVVSKTITGDLYAVNAAAITKYQGSAGGAETLFSQNGAVGSLPGVNRYAVGSGPGYGGQGQLSIRGGAPDQVGYELDGIPLNRGFDFYNGTSFNTNGLASLEVYTGGAPADSGRAMSGYINEIIQRGKYPGGGSITAVMGSPLFDHSLQASVYGGTPDNRFTYYVSTLATNNYVNFGDRSNLANTSFTVPAGDPGCGQFNIGPVPANTGGGPLDCGLAVTLNQPVSQGAYASTPFNAGRDTATNLHWTFQHNGLSDDLQGLYVVGTTVARPYGLYGTAGADPFQTTIGDTGTSLDANGNIQWPTGAFYQGAVGSVYNPANLLPLTWPTSGGSLASSCVGGGPNPATGLPFCGGTMPANFEDSESTQYSIEKVAFTRALNQSSFLRIYGYKMYSMWNLDQPINGVIGFSFYQLHDNATGAGFNYENQLGPHNLIKLIGDWSRDITLRYNYAPQATGGPRCALGGVKVSCDTPGALLTRVGIPFSTFNTITPLDWDGVFQDTFKPSDNLQFDLGLRWDEFGFQLMPQPIYGPGGLAYLAEEVDGLCLDGFNYSPSDPAIIGPGGNQNCNQLLQPGGANNPGGDPRITPGGFAWQNPPAFAGFTDLSPRFGVTWNLDPRDVVRASAGRYVQPPNSAFEQYTRNPRWGPGAATSLLNSFMLGLGFQPFHDILPEDSTNYDFSIEHEFAGGTSVKITPFYRNTRDQILSIPFNPASPSFVTGDNFGNARIKGLEFLLQKNVTGQNGIGGTIAATYTDAKVRFNIPRGGTTSFIDVLNGTNSAGVCQGSGICGYNQAYGLNYPLLDPNGYYSPSFVMAPTATGPSYDIQYVVNITPEIKANGFDVLIPISYTSGSPYGDALLFPDPHCPYTNVAIGTPPAYAVPPNAHTGCLPAPVDGAGNITHLYYGGNGPDPYTAAFDGPGSLKGPTVWTLNLAVSHDLGPSLKATILGTNLVTQVSNHGYAWEQPTGQHNASYGDNTFYNSFPLGTTFGAYPNPAPAAYYGNNYYPYVSAGVIPYRDWVFQLDAKI